MKKLAILLVLALELAVCGCGTTPPATVINTSTNGLWEAKILGGSEASLLGFTTTFIVENSGPLNVTSFAFFNQGSCFENGLNEENVSGLANFTTTLGTDQVTGTLNLTVKSIASGNVLTLSTVDGGLTGTSNGTTGTTGTLSDGVAVGTWTLTGPCTNGANPPPSGNFIMCQGTATCTPP
jgi:hypothetical protein